MSNNNQSRPQPLMLVLTLLAAIGLSSILQFVVPNALNWFSVRPSSQTRAYVSLFYQIVAFPFWMPCVVWLAARSGRTVKSTWTVPLILLAAPILIGFLISVIAMVASFPQLGQLRIGHLLYFQWVHIIRTSLFSYVLLAFFFRTTTLHLRPVEVQTLPNRLTVRSILLLTTVVAIGLSIDALAYQLVSTGMRTRTPQNSVWNLFNILTDFFRQLSIALGWFSAAWLFVARNPKRWIGLLA